MNPRKTHSRRTVPASPPYVPVAEPDTQLTRSALAELVSVMRRLQQSAGRHRNLEAMKKLPELERQVDEACRLILAEPRPPLAASRSVPVED